MASTATSPRARTRRAAPPGAAVDVARPLVPTPPEVIEYDPTLPPAAWYQREKARIAERDAAKSAETERLLELARQQLAAETQAVQAPGKRAPAKPAPAPESTRCACGARKNWRHPACTACLPKHPCSCGCGRRLGHNRSGLLSRACYNRKKAGLKLAVPKADDGLLCGCGVRQKRRGQPACPACMADRPCECGENCGRLMGVDHVGRLSNACYYRQLKRRKAAERGLA